MLATLLRFIPYVGVWIAAAGPILLAIGVAPGWGKFAWTVSLYSVLELVAANFVEPFSWLVHRNFRDCNPGGRRLLDVAMGTDGLLLSTPLTVCVVVIGRYVPHLEFLGILFGDEPAYRRPNVLSADDCERCGGCG